MLKDLHRIMTFFRGHGMITPVIYDPRTFTPYVVIRVNGTINLYFTFRDLNFILVGDNNGESNIFMGGIAVNYLD